jgi:hypothetical protein
MYSGNAKESSEWKKKDEEDKDQRPKTKDQRPKTDTPSALVDGRPVTAVEHKTFLEPVDGGRDTLAGAGGDGEHAGVVGVHRLGDLVEHVLDLCKV